MARKMLLCVLVSVWWFLRPSIDSCQAQQTNADGSIPIAFHVTSIKKDQPEDYCTTGTCSATRFTVEGYARVAGDMHFTGYVLTCVEYIQFGADNKNPNSYCARLRANGTFDAKLYADFINFADDEDRKSASARKGMMAAFEIKSEREIPNPKQ
jgi:hypothetical protein